MQIDFYVIDATSNLQANVLACRLLEKKYLETQTQIYVHMNTREEAERFDSLLWTFKDDSFIPHDLVQNKSSAQIQIGYADYAASDPEQLLLNLSDMTPPFYMQFNFLIEIVYNDARIQQLARERYKFYRGEGCQPNTIKLKANEL